MATTAYLIFSRNQERNGLGGGERGHLQRAARHAGEDDMEKTGAFARWQRFVEKINESGECGAGQGIRMKCAKEILENKVTRM